MSGRAGGRATRAGISAPEVIVALLLGLFVVHLGLTTLARLSAARARLAARTDGLVAMRVARYVLRRELRHGLPGEDWWVDRDSVYLRAYRGTATVCSRDSASVEITVSYAGDRLPAPSKDSVLLLDSEGSREVRALTSVVASTAGCPPFTAGSEETWRLSGALPPGSVIARLFERGSYHLSSSALRYRRAGAGRQPLTPEVWSPTTAWVLSGTRLGLEAQHHDSIVGPSWEAFLAWADSL